jgi:hypothetical protein
MSDREPERPIRRDFMRGALSAIPTGGLLVSACYADTEFEAEPFPRALLNESFSQSDLRTRWVQLHDAYVGRKNLHDLDGIVGSFSDQGELVINDLPAFVGAHAIADGQRIFGLSSEQSGLADTRFFPQREFFTSDRLLVEGRVFATHTGTVLGYPGTLRSIEMYYAALYRFDEQGKIISEHMTMNWAPLAGG